MFVVYLIYINKPIVGLDDVPSHDCSNKNYIVSGLEDSDLYCQIRQEQQNYARRNAAIVTFQNVGAQMSEKKVNDTRPPLMA